MPGQRCPSVTLICEHCREPFHPWKKHKPSRFCSHECARAAGATGRPRRADRFPDRVCKTCGVKFTPDKPDRTFCSRKCYRESGVRTMSSHGYVLVYRPEHPRASKSGQVLEHRVVMEEHLGRLLDAGETVHHMNGDRTDNRVENLQLRRGRHGKGVVHRCRSCGSTDIEAVQI